MNGGWLVSLAHLPSCACADAEGLGPRLDVADREQRSPRPGDGEAPQEEHDEHDEPERQVVQGLRVGEARRDGLGESLLNRPSRPGRAAADD